MNHSTLTLEQVQKIKTLVKKYSTNIEGLAILKSGNILLETYYNSKGSDYKFNVASVTKSVMSLLIGIAIDKEYIKSVDETVMSFFPEHHFSDSNRFRHQLTIKELLTMTAPFPFPNMNEPLIRLGKQKDWIEYGLKIMGSGGKVGSFKYSTTGAHLLSGILTKATGMTAREFANTYLFEPLGIEKIPDYPMIFDLDHVFGKKMRGWVSDPKGNNSGGWGLTLSLMDMTKIGQLCLQRGVFNGEQIVSSNWLDDSIVPVKTTYGNYGYLWWIGEEEGEFMAAGSGGNLIYINENKQVVIAITATIISKHIDRMPFIHALLEVI